MNIVIKPNGVIISIYSETLNFTELGHPHIRRASHVEPNCHGEWTADLSPVNGPQLGPFHNRSEAIDAELEYLNSMLNEIAAQEENS